MYVTLTGFNSRSQKARPPHLCTATAVYGCVFAFRLYKTEHKFSLYKPTLFSYKKDQNVLALDATLRLLLHIKRWLITLEMERYQLSSGSGFSNFRILFPSTSYKLNMVGFWAHKAAFLCLISWSDDIIWSSGQSVSKNLVLNVLKMF